jgi:hypothetical protein
LIGRTTVRSSKTAIEGSWNHLMSELTPEPDSTGGGKKKQYYKKYII